MSLINLTNTFDAKLWVDEWIETITKNPSIPTDKEAMLGWFANALMAGYNRAKKENAGRNYQYTEYQVRQHNANLFCRVDDCPHCLEVSRLLANLPISVPQSADQTS